MRRRKKGAAFYAVLILGFLFWFLFKNYLSESVFVEILSSDTAKTNPIPTESDTVITFNNQPEDLKDSVNKSEESQSILLCGDSMAGGLAEPFSDYAAFHNYAFNKYIWGASTTAAWSATGKLKKLISQYKPTYVIFALGSNELMTKSLSTLKIYAEGILKQVTDVKFVWIGPPNWKEDNGFNETLINTVDKGKYFDSENLILERVNDGKHLSQKGYYAWADSISAWIENESSEKIKIVTPDANTGARFLNNK
jgi:hypothetical protein